ncbi:hypothetical protein Hanom_Chr02g00115941 [Helianthus anomalus]
MIIKCQNLNLIKKLIDKPVMQCKHALHPCQGDRHLLAKKADKLHGESLRG